MRSLSWRWSSAILSLCLIFCPGGPGETPFAEELKRQEVTLEPQDRILVLAPHPDDEVIGCGGIIQQALARGLPVREVFFTYGDSNQWSFFVYRKHPVVMPKAFRGMGLLRHDEAFAAAKALRLAPGNLTFLGYPDLGTLSMWHAHWGDRRPFKSPLTMAESVPYANALRPGAPYKGEEALKDIESVLREFKPTKIFVSHPEDSHPDHRALYLFTRIALWDMASELRPQLYPYLVHFTNWPQPRGYHPDESSEPPTALGDRIPWQIYRLTREEIGRKEGALKAHRTQYESSTAYLSEFVRRNELFGDFPSLTLSPHIPSLTVSPNRQAELLETQEELTARERAAFVGIEERYVQLKNGSFVLSIKFSRSLGEEVGISALIFGYRADVPFARMPKLHIKVGLTGHKVYDQNRSLSPKSIRVVRETRRITLQVPLKILGYPERVLTSTHSFLANVPLDRVSWRAVELSSGK